MAFASPSCEESQPPSSACSLPSSPGVPWTDKRDVVRRIGLKALQIRGIISPSTSANHPSSLMCTNVGAYRVQSMLYRPWPQIFGKSQLLQRYRL